MGPEDLARLKGDRPFQSALESGIRALAILAEAHPASYDLQRLLFFDYLVVHSEDAGGPASLHASTPLRNGELLVRRGLVERGLLLMVSRKLLIRNFNDEGIGYEATDDAGPFLDCLSAPYTIRLKETAAWAVHTYGPFSDEALKGYFDRNFERWTREFQAIYPGASEPLQ